MIKVFKFGGASVKNAEAVRNLSQILKHFSDSSIVIVVSAMGKTTNALEKLLEAAREKASDFDVKFDQIKDFHVQIIDELFGESSESVKRELETYFISLRKHLMNILYTRF
jgi:aspartate kinase